MQTSFNPIQSSKAINLKIEKFPEREKAPVLRMGIHFIINFPLFSIYACHPMIQAILWTRGHVAWSVSTFHQVVLFILSRRTFSVKFSMSVFKTEWKIAETELLLGRVRWRWSWKIINNTLFVSLLLVECISRTSRFTSQEASRTVSPSI